MIHSSFYADEIGTISFPYLSLVMGGNTDYDNNEEREDEDDFDNEDADMIEEAGGMSDKTEIKLSNNKTVVAKSNQRGKGKTNILWEDGKNWWTNSIFIVNKIDT